MFLSLNRGSRFSKGLTILEMVVVLAVIAVILAFVAPATLSSSAANSLTAQGDHLYNQLTLARQTAITENRMIEVRFYNTVNKDEATLDTRTRTRSFVLVGTGDDGNPEKVSSIYNFEKQVVISSAAGLSTLTDEDSEGLNTGTNSDDILPNHPSSTSYTSFTFLPSGSTNLGDTSDGIDDTWHLTLTSATDDDLAIGTGETPKNYYTIQVSPHLGSLQRYRP